MAAAASLPTSAALADDVAGKFPTRYATILA
jgi:hypothetical protein